MAWIKHEVPFQWKEQQNLTQRHNNTDTEIAMNVNSVKLKFILLYSQIIWLYNKVVYSSKTMSYFFCFYYD